MNGGSNRGQYEPTTRWGPVVVIAAVVLMIVLLVALFAALSGGSESGGKGRQSAADAPRAGNPAAVSEESTFEESTSSTSEAPEQTAPGTDEEQADTGTGEEGEADGELSASDEGSATNQPVSEEDDVQEEEPDSGGEGAGEKGAVNEPGGFDPLNKNAEPGDLTETDRERARLTVWKFVSSAYGFSGEDKTAYARGVEQNVVLPDFYESPAGDAIAQRVQNFEEEEASGAAKLEDFEIETTEPERVVGTAVYATADSFATNGDLKGEKSEYSQRITLVPQGEIYKVNAASQPRELD